MLRFYFVIIISIYLIIYYIVVADHYSDNRDKYDEFSCYNLARRMIGDIQKRANIRTIAYGKDKLPKGEGGYIMYANHQGKYDALGIIASWTRSEAGCCWPTRWLSWWTESDWTRRIFAVRSRY